MHLRTRLLLLAALAGVVGVWEALEPGRWLTLEALQGRQQALLAWREGHPVAAMVGYVVVYTGAAALSVPGAAVLTLAGGALFGLLWGTLLAAVAATAGATLAFLGARHALRGWVASRLKARWEAVDAGVRREGAFYLLTLRLVPAVPFFVVNLTMGLTTMDVGTFAGVSLLGMLPGTLAYVNAGTELGRLQSLGDVLSPALWGAFAALAVLPWLGRGVVTGLQRRRALAPWPRPRRFDRNLVVIGGGSAGLVTAYIAAAVRARVTLIEAHRLGGDCLNTGCVPSKALIRATRLLAQLARAHEFGVLAGGARPEFSAVMERVQRVVAAIEPHDSAARYTALGVEVLEGRARLASPWEVIVTHPDGAETRLTTRAIVLATGARPTLPPIPGLEATGYLTSDTVWGLRELPRRLLVLGGGVIGCELGQAFARLGAAVTIVDRAPRLLAREDEEAAAAVAQRLRAEGLRLCLAHEARAFEHAGGDRILVASHEGREVRLAFDAVLVAVGRTPNVTGLGLEDLGIATAGTVEVDARLRTRFPHILAAGDVAGPWQLTHAAAHQAWHAAVNALFAPLKTFRVDGRVVPRAVFTEPEVAHVGLTEAEAAATGVAVEVTRYGLEDLDRAIADGETEGFVKVLTAPGTDRILGATIVGAHAGDLVAEWALAMRHRLGLNAILGTVHVYPTMAEANKYVAGAWKRSHAPQRLLTWVARMHRWRLG
ncbi:MAG: FAD-dependent oxidoreductase [Candidatus Sericytochromatia bacterium]|nr:FAD-dependent oxidoreductase [Candidatus Sericytochromatia bacterium]